MDGTLKKKEKYAVIYKLLIYIGWPGAGRIYSKPPCTLIKWFRAEHSGEAINNREREGGGGGSMEKAGVCVAGVIHFSDPPPSLPSFPKSYGGR